MGRILLLFLAIGIAYWIAYVTIWSAIGGVAYGLYRWLGPQLDSQMGKEAHQSLISGFGQAWQGSKLVPVCSPPLLFTTDIPL